MGRRLLAGSGVVGLALLVALATNIALNALSVAKLVFLLGGFVLLIPTIVLKDPKAYWLFLLILSIPFDISKWLSDPALTAELVAKYGSPASGTVSLEVYLTDVVLAMMLLPWLARVGLRRDGFYFPRFGYLFVFFLAWSLLVSIINSESFILSIFELYRQAMYLLLFVYLINNLSTRRHIMSVVCAMFLAFVISAGSVIVFFAQGIGTDKVAFASLHDQPVTSPSSRKATGKDQGSLPLTVNSTGRVPLGSSGEAPGIKRSQGIFRHPAIPGGLCGLFLPLVLAYFLAARETRDRILLVAVFIWGVAGLILTFSRAGLVGLTVGVFICFVVASWSGMISRRVFRQSAIAFFVVMAFSIPLTVIYLTTRPDAFSMRWNIFAAALQGYAQHPLLGVGLNNGTGSMREGRLELQQLGVPVPPMESAESFYLSMLVEVGPVGSILFFGFFGKIIAIALKTVKEARSDFKPLLVGMIAGIASLATQSLVDGPTAGHVVSGLLWVFAALTVVIARNTRNATPVSGHFANSDSGKPQSHWPV